MPELALRELAPVDAAALLASALTGALDPRVRDRILAECHGNPLALLELPRGLSAAEPAFGGDGGTATPLASRLERSSLRQVRLLPPPSQPLRLTAAAEPVGDLPQLGRAAEHLGVGTDAAEVAEAAGLVECRDRVRVRHPLVRSRRRLPGNPVPDQGVPLGRDRSRPRQPCGSGPDRAAPPGRGVQTVDVELEGVLVATIQPLPTLCAIHPATLTALSRARGRAAAAGVVASRDPGTASRDGRGPGRPTAPPTAPIPVPPRDRGGPP